MEELLRAYAKKRREQAEPALQMHPATRKLLQDEVKRTLGATAAPPRHSWPALRWPLLVLGSGFAALLVMFAVINTQMRHLLPATAPMNQTLSQANPALKKSAPVAEGTASPVPGVASAKETAAVEPSGRSLAETPAPLTPAALGGGGRAAVPAAAQTTFEALGAPAGSPGAVVENERGPAVALSASASRAPGVIAGEFVQIHDRTQEKAAQLPLSNVLSSFRLQRSGQNVRVVDADGSVYDGLVLSGVAGGARLGGGGGGGRYGRARQSKDTEAEADWSFKVMGTNAHLQQYIVFTGNVLGMPATPPPGYAGARTRSASPIQTAPASAPVASAPVSPAANPRIKGKVQVGGGKEYEIEAKPPVP